jgi:hypothetical protein
MAQLLFVFFHVVVILFFVIEVVKGIVNNEFVWVHYFFLKREKRVAKSVCQNDGVSVGKDGGPALGVAVDTGTGTGMFGRAGDEGMTSGGSIFMLGCSVMDESICISIFSVVRIPSWVSHAVLSQTLSSTYLPRS